MSTWLANAVDRGGATSDWLSPKRQQSLELLQQSRWPTRKTEAWKYTSVNMLADATFAETSNGTFDAPENIDNLDSIDLLLVDGILRSDIADLPSGLSIYSIADTPIEQREWAAEIFTGAKPSTHYFGLVNDVLATTGVLIDVAESVKVDRPIRVICRQSNGCESHTRILMRLGSNAEAVVIEDFAGEEKSFNTGFSEYIVGESATLEHYRIAMNTGEAVSIGGCHFNLNYRSALNSSVVGFGSSLSRLDIDVNHIGEYATAKLNAFYLLNGSETFDLHSSIEHIAANGTSEENVRGIVADSARAVFNGRIHIHRNAQKTLAELNNRNLLLSRNAEIYTKPELEIYADDVRCAHGATVAEIDKEALYYLQSRGMSKAQAQIMLSFGFINELVDQMPNQDLAAWLRPYLRRRFAEMESTQ